MSWDNVPWLVGGGAEHSPEVARALAYAATGGKEGVTTPEGLKVSALATPGSSVRVAPGVAAVLNRDTGGAQQTYILRNISDTNVAITATGSGSGRSDLVIARVEDPFNSGTPWATPTDPKVGPYVHARVIVGVAPGTTKVPPGYGNAIALARIDIPVSTATITDAMITSVRTMPSPRRERDLTTFVGGAVQAATQTLNTWTTWPAQVTRSVEIPAWATRVSLVGSLGGVVLRNAGFVGYVRLKLGTLLTPAAGVDLNAAAGGNPQRVNISVGGSIEIPANLRGTTQTLTAEVQRLGETGALESYSYSLHTLDVEFEERAS